MTNKRNQTHGAVYKPRIPDVNLKPSQPRNRSEIPGMDSWQPDVALARPGFAAEGDHLVKKGTPYGEGAMLNQLPPGMNIGNQRLAEDVPMGDLKFIMANEAEGGFKPRDIPETKKK